MLVRSTNAEPLDEQIEFLSSVSASQEDRIRALAVVVVSVTCFVVAVPFAQVPLIPLPAFIPIYQSALIVNDAIMNWHNAFSAASAARTGSGSRWPADGGVSG